MQHYTPPDDVAATVFDPTSDTFGPIMAAMQSGDFATAATLTAALASTSSMSYDAPNTRAQNDAMTKDFTELLATYARDVLGADVPPVFQSGNAGPEDEAWTFEATVNEQTFNVEVFGPWYAGEDDDDESDD